MSSQPTALVLIDFIRELVHPEGRLAGRGYTDFIARHGTEAKVRALLERARGQGWLVAHVRVGFDPDYAFVSESSPLFSLVRKAGALRQDGPGCDFVDWAAPQEGEITLRKRRVSALHGTELEPLLRAQGIGRLLVAGCATDLAVQSTVRQAHDCDFYTAVVADACVAASDADHVSSLAVLAKLARVIEVGEL